MSDLETRQTLERLIRENGDDFATISRMLGKNTAYIQQFIRRGTPKKLDEVDRRKLADFYQVDEHLLGGQAVGASFPSDMVAVRQIDVDASAGAGAIADDDSTLGTVHFPKRWLKSHGVNASTLALVRVLGDSMLPTLSDGDDIMVDHSIAGAALRDGIHVIRLNDMLMVKRLSVAPSGRLSVLSDNPQYRDYEDVAPQDVEIVGRVVWTGRFL